MSVSSVQRLFAGQESSPSLSTLDKIAAGLGVTTASLLSLKTLPRPDFCLPAGVALARKLAELRKRRAWTQKELGIQSHVSMFLIAHIERGARNPTLQTLERLAAALEVSAEELLSHKS